MLLTREHVLGLPGASPDERYRYGNHPEQLAELYLPSSLPAPVVVLLHGGCWRAGVSLRYLGQLARALAEEGMAVWNVEYRRLGAGGGWPTTFLDAAAAVDLLATVGQEKLLDLKRVVAVGHSAGGHLALWLAGRKNLPDNSALYRASPLALTGVVSLAGIPDLAAATDHGICGGAPRELLGGSPDEVERRYLEGSPVNLLPLNIPQVIINGDRDDIVPVEYAASYARMARARGEDVRFEALPGCGHFEPVVAASSAWPAVKQAVWSVLSRQGYSSWPQQ